MSSLKIGDIDVGDQVLQNEYLTNFVLELISLVVNKNQKLIQTPTPGEIEEIKKKVLKQLQTKYPNSGIKLNT